MESNTNIVSFRNEPVLLIIFSLVLLNVFNISIYWAYLTLPLFIILFRANSEILDYNFLYILIFSVLYILCLYLTGLKFEDLSISVSIFIGYFLFPAIFYFMGKYIVFKYPSATTIYFFLFFICFLFSLLPFLANVKSVLEQGFMQERNIRLFWMEKGTVVNATGVGSYFAINMALLPLLFTQKVSAVQKRLTIFSALLFAIGLFSTFNMSNRTGLLITFMSLLLFIFLPKNSMMSILFVSCFLILVIILYSIDAWGFRFWFEHSAYFNRLSHTSIYEQDSRLMIWKSNLISLIKHPYGNFRPGIGNDFAHNLWLDVGLRTGFIPIIPLLVFSISSMVSVGTIIFNKNQNVFLRVLIACFAISFYVTFFLEPVLEGIYIMFYVFCLYIGMVQGIRKYMIGSD